MQTMLKVFRSFRVFCFTHWAKYLIGSHQGSLFAGGYCRLTKDTSVGHHVSFNGMKIRGRGKVTIGNYFHSGSGCEILTENHNYEGTKLPYDDTFIVKDVLIGDYVWLGNRVMILPGVTIGEGAIIQAGSVVVSDIPDCAIAGGHPARVFSSRNKEHYQNLKEQGKAN